MPIVKVVSTIKDRDSSVANKSLSNLVEYLYDKTKRPNTEISDILNYADNKNKNYNNLEFISSINGLSRNKDLAKKQFYATRESRLAEKNKLNNKKVNGNSRFLYHFVVSFNKHDTEKYSWKELHKFSEKIAKEICGNDYQAFLSSHLPSSEASNDYFHTHIIVNAYSNKVRGNKLHLPSGYVEKLISRTNDMAKTYDYSVVTDPLQKKYPTKDKSWFEYQKYKNNDSWKERLKKDLDYVRNNSNSYPEYIEKVKELGYGLRYKNFSTGKLYKDVSYIPKLSDKENKSIRGNRLGVIYSRKGLEEYFALSKDERDKFIMSEKEKDLSKIYYEKKKEELLNSKIFKNITFNGKIKRIKIYDRNKNKKTDLEIKLELEYEDKIDEPKKNKDYVRRLYETLNFVSALKIENIDQLQSKIEEKDKLYSSLFQNRKKLKQKLSDYQAYDIYFKSAIEFGQLELAERESNIKYDDLKIEILRIEGELKSIDKKLESLKIYSSDLNKCIKFYDYRGSLLEYKYNQEKYISKQIFKHDAKEVKARKNEISK